MRTRYIEMYVELICCGIILEQCFQTFFFGDPSYFFYIKRPLSSPYNFFKIKYLKK